MDDLDKNMCPDKYLEGRVMEYVKGIEAIAQTGSNEDSTRLKAYTTLLNKRVPDITKMDLDIKNTSPYELFMKGDMK